MATVWSATRIDYSLHAAGHPLILAVGAVGVDEDAVDAAVQAFADAYNVTYETTSVTKSYAGTGVSDWSYTPT